MATVLFFLSAPKCCAPCLLLSCSWLAAMRSVAPASSAWGVNDNGGESEQTRNATLEKKRQNKTVAILAQDGGGPGAGGDSAPKS